ncbi:MAG: hypothetical protein OSB09_08935 [Planctomycetota bacterium]|nr:hypothetical protein [Planctomycetota bacterium]
MRFLILVSTILWLTPAASAQGPIPPTPTGAEILLELGTIQYDAITGAGSVPLMMTSTIPIAAFQFDLIFNPSDVLLTSAYDGLAYNFGYTLGVGPTSGTVLGYSLALVEIPPTILPEVLVIVGFQCDACPSTVPEICIENSVFADIAANPIPTELGPCSSGTANYDFLRGDCNTDGGTNVADAIFLLASLFSAGPDSACIDGCDSNDDNAVNIADAIHFLSFLFNGGAPPAPPGADFCGPDLTDDILGCRVPGPCP